MQSATRVIATSSESRPTLSDEFSVVAAASPASGESSDGDARRPAPARSSGSGSQPKLPRILRPAGLPRAVRPGDVPQPEHHHLPGWVRRVHGQARPILGDLLGNLEGDARERYTRTVNGFIEQISAGKFSVAFQYPAVISEGEKLFNENREVAMAARRAQRSLETARKKATDLLREEQARLAPDVAARLSRTLRQASEVEEITAVEREIQGAVGAARSSEVRRRDREIDRTRSRILKSLPRGSAPSEPTESWQDVLRRFAEEQRAAEE